MRKSLFLVIFFIGFIYSNQALAQSDSLASGPRNVIKFNISSRILWGGDNYVFGYERQLKNPYHTISISLGYRTMPKLISAGKSDSAFIVRSHENKGGLSASFDYRFYLKKHNVSVAPKGVYVAPFIDYFSNHMTNDFSAFGNSNAIENEFRIDTKLKLYSLGFKLGYQFVFWDRFSVDLVLLGPSYTYYTANFKLEGEVDPDEESEYYQKLKDAIIDKYPLTEGFLDEKEVTKKGDFTTGTLGFHYSISIGFAF